MFDDRVLIVQNESLHFHSPRQLAHIWKSGYWPDPHGLELYPARIANTVGSDLGRRRRLASGAVSRHRSSVGSGRGASPLLLLPRRASPGAHRVHCRAAFLLSPATDSSANSVCARGFSKESAAAFAALPVIFPRKDWRSRDTKIVATGAAAIIATALLAHRILSRSSQIPPIDNPIALLALAGGATYLVAQTLTYFSPVGN